MPDQDYRNREFETGTPYTRMESYVRSVYPHHVRDHARRILKDTEPGYERYRYAAELTRYVHEEINYSRESEVWRGDYLIEHKGEGDCEDQSVLLASLLACRSFEVRFIVTKIEGEEYGHIMIQVLFEDVDIDRLTEEAEDLYGDVSGLRYEEGEDGRYWLNCDPTYSPMPGAIPADHLSTVGRLCSGGEGIEYNKSVLRDYLYV